MAEGRAYDTAHILGMVGGEGEESYSNNSSAQLHWLEAVEDALWTGLLSTKAIPDDVPGAHTLRVADLGCATGRNTITAVDRLLSNLKSLWRSKSAEFPREVQVSFSDLPSNDFNSLFAIVCSPDAGRSYFPAAVPGSFYGRLFPASSIHAFTCFNSLHWMSQVPAEVLDKHSPAYNADRVNLEGASPAVIQAFSRQHHKDFKAFLSCRAEELVPGGFLLLSRLSRAEDKECEQPAGADMFTPSFRELIAEGLIEQELLDTFNIPVYLASLAEMRRAVEEQGSFHIQVLQSFTDVPAFHEEIEQQYRSDPARFAKAMLLFTKSITYAAVEAHVGATAASLIFQKHKSLLDSSDLHRFLVVDIVVAVLVRK